MSLKSFYCLFVWSCCCAAEPGTPGTRPLTPQDGPVCRLDVSGWTLWGERPGQLGGSHRSAIQPPGLLNWFVSPTPRDKDWTPVFVPGGGGVQLGVSGQQTCANICVGRWSATALSLPPCYPPTHTHTADPPRLVLVASARLLSL